MEFYINGIDEIVSREKFIEDLNNNEYNLHEDFMSAKVEAQLGSLLAWAIYDSPVITYKFSCSSEGVVDFNSLEKVGETGVEDDSEGMSKQEILNMYNLSEGDINDIPRV